MADLFVALDLTQEPGEQLSPEMRAEIAVIAPSVVNAGSITTNKLHDDAVTHDKLGPEAVQPDNLAENAVENAALADAAVHTDNLADAAVTLAKAGVGVATATDKTGTPRSLEISGPYTAAEYGAIVGGPDPNTLYVIT